MYKKLTPIILAISVLVTACNTAGMEGKDNNQNIPTNTNKVEDSITNINEIIVYDNFIDKYQDVKVYEMELDHSDKHGYQYEIKGYDNKNEYEEKISVSTGEVIKSEIEQLKTYDGFLLMEDIKKIDEFVKLALDDAGDEYNLYQWSLKVKNTGKMLEIEVKNKQNKEIEYKYNIETGELLEKDM